MRIPLSQAYQLMLKSSFIISCFVFYIATICLFCIRLSFRKSPLEIDQSDKKCKTKMYHNLVKTFVHDSIFFGLELTCHTVNGFLCLSFMFLPEFQCNSVADPGFPRGGGTNPKGGGANLLFGQSFSKTA